jgi:hypothetical protein
MAKEDNLIPLNKKSKEEQRRIQSMGGKASQAKQKEKRLMSKIILNFLEVTPEETFNKSLLGCLENKDSSSIKAMDLIHKITEGNKAKQDQTEEIENDKTLLEKLIGK